MKNISLLLIFFIIFNSPYVHSAKRKSKKKFKFQNVVQVPSTEKVKTREWARYMRTSLKKDLCSKSGPLNQCFKVSSGKCKMEVFKSFNECAKPLRKMKKIAPFGPSGINMAMKIGQCIGTRYEQKFKNKKTNKDGC